MEMSYHDNQHLLRIGAGLKKPTKEDKEKVTSNVEKVTFYKNICFFVL